MTAASALRFFSGVPCVTIITPYYNPGGQFRETVTSVLAQTHTDWEWLVIDDGSDDLESREILCLVDASEPRVQVRRLPKNVGISCARNAGIKEAAGEFLVFLDADDLLEPTFLEKCLWRLLTQPGWSFTKGHTWAFGARSYKWKNGFHDGAKFLDENRVTPTAMVRTAAARAVGGFDESMRDGLEDWDFWLRLASAGYWGGTIPEVLDHYRTRPDHADRWKSLGRGGRREFAEQRIRERYRQLDKDIFSATPSPRRTPPEWRETTRAYWPVPQIGGDCIWMILPHLELGGADRLNLDLLRYWRECGSSVVVITTRRADDSWIQAFRELTPLIYSLPKFLPAAAYPAFLEMLVGARKPAAVYLSHSEAGYLLAKWLKVLVAPAPLVDLLHIVVPTWKNGGYPRMSVLARDSLDATVVTSLWLKNWVCTEGHDPERVHVVYTGVDTERWRPSSSRTGICRLLFAARFVDQKNPRVLRQIVERLLEAKVRFELLVAGSGPDRPWLEDNLFRPFARHVRDLGAVSAEDVKNVMGECDVLLLPSADEGIALVLFEAMSLELAVVATAVGGQRELITDDSGILIARTTGWEGHFAAAVVQVAADGDRRRQLGRKARERITSHFNFSQTAKRMTELLLQPPGGTRRSHDSYVDIDQICAEIVGLENEDSTGDEWGRLSRRRFSLVSVVSALARFARGLPFAGPVFRYMERRVGERLGRWVLALSRAR